MVVNFDRYKILEKIGQGGFAVVYRARDTRLERPVALKELRQGLLHDAEWVKRFTREAKTIAQLNHPRIVTIYDVVEVDERLCIVMRLVDGPSLEELLNSQGRLPWSQVLETIFAIAEALKYAHAQGILHRDLKPGNILLDAERGPQLSDFGLAKLAGEAGSSVTAAGGIVGTPHYIAPEVWQSRGTTPQSDLYALGCILFEMITGKKPFTGDSPPAIMMAHFSPVNFPDTWPEDVPAGIADVLSTALAKEPADRYASVDAMVQALTRLTSEKQARALETKKLHIRLLGEFQLSYDDKPIMTINSARLQSLLGYLALHCGGPQSRQRLAFLFWPDSTERQAHTNLRNLLHRFRRALPHADFFLNIDSHTLQWRPDGPFSLDVAGFESAAAETALPTAWQEAVALYSGALLPGCYDEWILAERERLQIIFIDTLERLAQYFEQQQEYQSAIRYAQQLLQNDPVHEATHRQIMRLHALKGDRAGALRAYHTCVTVLQRELAVGPSQATRAEYERLLNQEPLPDTSPIPAPTNGSRSQLVGRELEWVELQAIWRATEKGRPHFVSISGEAGIGKTRLADELSHWAHRQGVVTATAYCHAAEGRLAYAPVVAWLKSPAFRAVLPTLEQVWLSEIARLLPEILAEHPDLPQPAPLTESWQRQRLFEALARATMLAGKPQSMLLHLDDIQWCDQETLEWLHYLLQYEPTARLLVIATLRPEDVEPGHPTSTLLLSLRRVQQLTEIKLDRLDADQTAELAAFIAQRELNPSLIARLHEDTEGNPLFIVETVQAGLAEGVEALDRTEQGGSSASLSDAHRFESPLPPRVQAVLEARLTQLSPQAQALACLAAAIGRAFTFEVLVQASPEDEDSLIGVLDELWQRGIVRELGTDAYDFSHHKLREVAYAQLGTARRRVTHRRVAQAIETVYAANLRAFHSQIAGHFDIAGQIGSAVAHYQSAAEVARQIYANDEAIQSYRQALELMGTIDPDNTEEIDTFLQLWEGLGDVLTLTGQHDQARQSYEEALRRSPSIDHLSKAHFYRKIGNTWRSQSQFEQALQTYLQAEAHQEQHPGSSSEKNRAWIQIQLERMWVYYWLNQWPESAGLAEKMQPVVTQHGTPSQQINFFISLSTIHLRRDRYTVSEDTIALCRDALAISQQSGSKGEEAWARFILGFNLLWFGALDEAETQMQQALIIAEQRGDVVHQARCLSYLTVTYRKRGLIDEARGYADRALAAAGTAHLAEYIGMAQANRAWVAWREDNVPEAQRYGQEALSTWQQLPSEHASYCFQWAALWPLMAVDLAQDKVERVIEHTRTLLAPPQQLLPPPLAEALENAIGAWEQNRLEATKSHFMLASQIAQELGYL